MRAVERLIGLFTKCLHNYGLMLLVIVFTACSKTVDVKIPAASQQVVVDGSIENGVPPIILLTKSQQFFGNVNLNDLGAYFIHGARLKVTASDGTHTDLVEFCLQDLNLPPAQSAVLLSALGYISADSANIINVCAYTVPDIINYYVSGTCSFMGKERTTYNLDIVSPGLYAVQDSIHLTSVTTIPTAIGMDSLAIRADPNPADADSFSAIYAYVTVPDTFGNFLRYKTKSGNEPFYTPPGGSVYDDKLFIGLKVGIPLERGQSPDAKFDLSTDTYFFRGDTVTVKWSNIDSKTYDFFYTLENDGGGSPFSSPIKIKTNIHNGLGVWAGYATKYYSIYVP
ncbi:MAG: hypothetical protein JWO06_2087 [Bacteroidota bacterium]|nr:hypothetical protein [Bacteroidota bacterium]